MKNFTLIVFSLFTINSFAQWTSTDAPSNLGRYDDVFFVNDSVGWAVNGAGKIVKTTNGVNWTIVEETGKYNRSIEFADEQLGFCGTLENTFLKSTDGGETWNDISDLITPAPHAVCGLSIPAPEVIYGCGAYFSPAFVIKSTDSGNSWTYIDMSAYATGLVDIHFTDQNTGFVVGRANPADEGGVVLYTQDGGATWEVKHKTLFPGDYIWKIQSPDGLNYFGAVQPGATAENTRMIKSADAGLTWENKIVVDSLNYVQMIGFINPEHGWIGGGHSEVYHYETTDGGESWEAIFQPGSNFNRFFRINSNLAYRAGNRISRYQVDSIVGLPDFADNVKAYHDLTVSPNPAGEEITISLKINSDTYCNLSVYDQSGKLISKLIDERVGAQEKKIGVSLAGIPSQTLFVALQTHEGLVVRKVVKR